MRPLPIMYWDRQIRQNTARRVPEVGVKGGGEAHRLLAVVCHLQL
jgi:hypothetical protein